MSTYFTSLETNQGLVHVLTKTRWLGFVRTPHTSVMPKGASSLSRRGSFIKWSSTDIATLIKLHEAVVGLVREIGPSGFLEIGNSMKMTQRLASAVGGDWHDIVKQATQDGVPFPIPDEVLIHVKSFA